MICIHSFIHSFMRTSLLLIVFNLALGAYTQVNDSLANGYMLLADNYKKNTELDSAVLYYDRAVVAFDKLGEIEPEVNALNQAGIILTRQDKYADAKQFLHKALYIGLPVLDSNNLFIASTYLALGVVHNAEKNYKESLNNHFKSLNIRLRVLGENHADVATNYGNIGNVYLNNQEFDKSIEAHLKALHIREFVFGTTGVEVIQSYNNLGNAYKEKNDYTMAFYYYEKALQNKIIQKGEGHKDLIKYYKNLSDVAYLMADTPKGDLYKSKADAIENKVD